MSKYGIKEIRVINSENLRRLCIEKNWCTNCDNDQYQYILNLCYKENITTDDIFSIAVQIEKYSNTEQKIETIMFDIARICNSYFEFDLER